MYHTIGKWKFISTLGTGAFGNVTQWQNQENDMFVAIKTCKLNPKELNQEELMKVRSRWKKECEIMNTIEHENIVRSCSKLCEDLVEDINRTVESNLPAIVMEYCDGGSLRDKLQEKENLNGFSEYDVREVLRALKDGIHYLHTRHKITHRDIKPDNIVLKTRSDGKIIYKLTDVGYARIIDTNTIAGSAVGTQNYFAPEIVLNAEYKNSVDYWSMGVVAFEIICGIHPFLHGELFFNVMQAINNKPEGCIAVTRNMDKTLKCHMELFPENRLSSVFSELIVPWLKLALNKDGRKRGYDEFKVMIFYTTLDAILDTKIVTVFWVNKCKFLSYNITESMTMQSLYERIRNDTNSTRLNISFPAGHTYSRMMPNMKPIQLYEEKFAIDDQPMMYLITFDGSDLCDPDGPKIPTIIPQIFGCSKESLCNANLLQCLHEFGMSLEDDILHIKPLVDDYCSKILNFNGQASQFEAMVSSLKGIVEQNQNSYMGSLNKEIENHALHYKNLFAEHLYIRNQYESNLYNIRAFIEQLQLSPIVKSFEQIARKVTSFQDENDFDRRPEREHWDSFITMIRIEITNLLNMRKMFFDTAREWLKNNNVVASTSNVSNGTPSDILNKIMMEHMRIYSVLQENQKLLNDAQIKVRELTESYLRQMVEIPQKERHESLEYESLIEKMDTIDISDISLVSADELIRQSEMLSSRCRESFSFMEDS